MRQNVGPKSIPFTIDLAAWPWTRAVCVLALAVIAGAFVRNARFDPVDLEAYRSAAFAVRDGQRLYERALLWRDLGIRPSPYDPNYWTAPELPFIYPPLVAILLLPLATLPFDAAKLLWLTINVACLLAIVRLLLRLLAPSSVADSWTLTLAVCALAMPLRPVRHVLANGQIDLQLLLLAVLSLRAFARRRDLQAGAWLALAMAVKPPLGFLVLLFCRKRAFKAFASTLVLAALSIAASLLALGVPTMLDYVAAAAYWSSAHFAVNPGNQSPYGALLRLFTENSFTTPVVEAPLLASGLRIAIVVGVVAIVWRTAMGARSVPSEHLTLECGTFLAGM